MPISRNRFVAKRTSLSRNHIQRFTNRKPLFAMDEPNFDKYIEMISAHQDLRMQHYKYRKKLQLLFYGFKRDKSALRWQYLTLDASEYKAEDERLEKVLRECEWIKESLKDNEETMKENREYRQHYIQRLIESKTAKDDCRLPREYWCMAEVWETEIRVREEDMCERQMKKVFREFYGAQAWAIDLFAQTKHKWQNLTFRQIWQTGEE